MTLNVDTSKQWDASCFEAEGIVCADCGAPLQEAPTWAEKPGQLVYRCPWTSQHRIRVEFHDPELLVYNCGWEKGNVARRLSEAIR